MADTKPVPQGEPVYTFKEMLAYLRICERMGRKLLSDGRLQGFRVGMDWRFTETQIQDYIRKNSNQPVAQEQAQG